MTEDEVFALEMTTHSGLSPYSFVPNILKHSSISLARTTNRLILW